MRTRSMHWRTALWMIAIGALIGCGGGTPNWGSTNFTGGGGEAPVDGGGGGATQSQNADLALLQITPGYTTPAFSPSQTTYTVGPSLLASSVRVLARPADALATMTLDGKPLVSSVYSAPIAIKAGANPLLVLVTAPGGATKAYTIVLTRDTPIAQEAFVKASNTNVGDFFGGSVSISGDTLVVGAPFESSSASGVNPGSAGEADNTARGYGAVYVFVRTGSTWAQQAYIKASNPDPSDHFGGFVSISKDTLVVSSIGESSNATGVNPGAAAEANNGAKNAGAVYVFIRVGTTWQQQAYLKASNTSVGDIFGRSVAVDGETIVVGSIGEQSPSAGVNPGAAAEADDSGIAVGAAYVFVRNGATWTQEAYLKASNPDSYDGFGAAVAISGNTIVVGAYGECSVAKGVNGGAASEMDNAAAYNKGTGVGGPGAAYVFVRNGTTWAQQAYVKASNTDMGLDCFGWSVAIAGDTIAIGAPNERSLATGVNPGAAGEADNSGVRRVGAVYVFTRTGVVWTQQAYVKASNPEQDDQFGAAVAIHDDLLVVGAQDESCGFAGIDLGPGPQADNSVHSAGAVYAYLRTGVFWVQTSYVKTATTPHAIPYGQGEWLGYSVAVDGDTIAVGAPGDDRDATGVNSETYAVKDPIPISGAAYVFR